MLSLKLTSFNADGGKTESQYAIILQKWHLVLIKLFFFFLQ